MFIDNIIDYCSLKLNYNKRYIKWNLIGHPLTKRDKRYWFLFFLMIMPTIEMALCIHIIKDVYLAIVVFHATIIIVPIIYLFINSKFIDPLDNTRYQHGNINRNENFDKIVNKFNKSVINYSNSSNNSNKKGSILIGGKTFKSGMMGIYDDIDNIDDGTDYLIDISKIQQYEPDMSLPTKIYRSLFSIPQFVIGLIVMIIGLAFGSLFYYLFAGLIPNSFVNQLTFYGMLNYSFKAEYIFYIYFSIINPIIEEWFWRLFLPNSFGQSKGSQIIITLFFSFYHFVVLTVFFNVYICALATLVVFIGGMMFFYVTKYVGPLASIMAHMAADVLIVFIISNKTLLWFPYLEYDY